MLRFFVPGLFILLLSPACVRSKVHKAEQALRMKSEARETVLVKEVLDRRAESTRLIDTIGRLNRAIGVQEAEISNLRAELASRTRQMGESSSKLLTEKMALEKDLALKEDELAKKNAIVNRLRDAREKRSKTLGELQEKLAKGYPNAESATITKDGESLLLTLSDKALFEPAGLFVSASGKTLLTPLATLLTDHPDLDVDLICYTDNALPKNKSLQDTWDWSLQRATNIARLLIREFNVSANQLTPIGRGEFYPVTSNETAEGRQKNRRTVVVIRPGFPALPGVD